MNEGGGHGRVHPAGEGAQDLAVGARGSAVFFDAMADVLHIGGYEVGRGPVLAGTRNIDNEVAQYLAAVSGVDDLRMKLDAVHATGRVGDGGIRRGIGSSHRPKALGKALDRIAMAHPDRLLRLESGEESVLGNHRYECRPELFAFERHDLAAEGLGHEMQAVADAEDWNAAAPERGVGVGRAFLVDAGRPAGQDYGLGLAGCDLTPWSVEGKQLRVDVEIAHAAGYEAAVLAAEVKDDDCVDVCATGPLVGRHGSIRHVSVAQHRPPLLSPLSLAAQGRADRPARVRSGSPACAGLWPALELLDPEADAREPVRSHGRSVGWRRSWVAVADAAESGA